MLAEHYDIAYQFRKSQAVRNSLDVLLLSGMSDDDIARLMSCDPQTVSVYTHTFFDVRWFLKATDAIAIHVFLNAATDQPERAVLLKLAYRGASRVVKQKGSAGFRAASNPSLSSPRWRLR